jgi:hypothetical protein
MSTSARKRVNVSWDDTISYSGEDQNKVLVSVRSRHKQSQRRKTIPFSCVAILLILLSLCYIYSTHRLQPSSGESVQNATDNIDTFPVLLYAQPTTNKTADIADYHFQTYFPNLPECGRLEIDFTLVTQSSEDRLWMMKHICSRWGKKHPVSLVLYTNRSYNEVIRDLRKMGCISFNNEDGNIHEKGTSLLQISDSSQYPPEEYPVNQLRNMALSAVQTSHAVYIDIDLWPSIGLYKSLHHPSVLEALALDPKLAIVIPSFQLNPQCPPSVSCPDKNLNKMPFTSVEIPTLILSKDVTQLDPTNIWGHGSTDYKQWFRIVNSLRKGEDKTYPALSNLTCIKVSLCSVHLFILMISYHSSMLKYLRSPIAMNHTLRFEFVRHSPLSRNNLRVMGRIKSLGLCIFVGLDIVFSNWVWVVILSYMYPMQNRHLEFNGIMVL